MTPHRSLFAHPLLRSLLLAGATLLAAGSALAEPATDLRGHWRSVAPEAYAGHFATREFDFGERDWQVYYRAFADAQGSRPLFTIHVQGSYVLGGPSATVAGAAEGVFPARSRSLMAVSEAGVQMFAGMGCRLQVGRELALVNTGCGFVPGVMQAMGEYDLASLQDGRLFLGDRSGDLTKSRPARLTPYPLVRVP